MRVIDFLFYMSWIQCLQPFFNVFIQFISFKLPRAIFREWSKISQRSFEDLNSSNCSVGLSIGVQKLNLTEQQPTYFVLDGYYANRITTGTSQL